MMSPFLVLAAACDETPPATRDTDATSVVSTESDTVTMDTAAPDDTAPLWVDTGIDTDVPCVPKTVLEDGPAAPANIEGDFDASWGSTTLQGVHGNFGEGVSSSAGDVDGDGIMDVVVGWYDVATQSVGAAIFLGPIQPGVVIEAPDTSAELLGLESGCGFVHLVDGDRDGRAEILGAAYPAVPWTAYVAPTSGVVDVDTAETTFSLTSTSQCLRVRETSDDDLWVADPVFGFVGPIYGGSSIYLLPGPLEGELSQSDAILRYEGPLEKPVGLSVDVGDLDGDGVQDVVTSGIEFFEDDGASYFHRGRAWFVTDPPVVDALVTDVASTEVQAPVGAWQPLQANVTDLDGDGYEDVLLSSLDADDDDGLELYVFNGPPPVGNVGFECATSTIVHDSAAITSVSVGDFNGDGFGDFVASAQDVGVFDLGLFYGPVPSGLTSYADADAMLGGGSPGRVGDASGDGIDDVLTADPFDAGGLVFVIPGG